MFKFMCLLMLSLLITDDSNARILTVKHYTKMDEITHILKRTVSLIGIKTRKRIIHLLPLESTAFVDTEKLKQRSFKIRTVIGKTNCYVFDGECYLHNVTEVAIVDIQAKRDKTGWLDIMHIAEGKKKLYEYIE